MRQKNCILIHLIIIIVFLCCASENKIDSSKKYPKYNQITKYSEGLAIFEVDINEFKSEYIIMDKNENKIKIEKFEKYENYPKFYRRFHKFNNGMAAFEIDGPKSAKTGFINTEGKIAIPPQTNIRFDNYYENMAVRKKGYFSDHDVYFIDLKGNKVLGDFNGAYRFSEGIAPVWINAKVAVGKDQYDFQLSQYYAGKWGFVDKTKKFIIKPQFDEALPFFDGLAPVRIGAKWIFLKYGFVVLTGGKWGYINKKGILVIKNQFDNAKIFSDGLAAVLVGAKHNPTMQQMEVGQHAKNEMIGGKWGYINTKGEFVIKPSFDEVESFEDGFATVWIKDKRYTINKNGEITE